MAQIVLGPSRAYPNIPTIGDTLESHTNALNQIVEALNIHERRIGNSVLDSFVRVRELQTLGLADIDGNIVTDASTEESTTHHHDSTYLRLDGTNDPVTSSVSFSGGLSATGLSASDPIFTGTIDVSGGTFTGLDSNDLADVASIAMLDEAETVTGLWTFDEEIQFTPQAAPAHNEGLLWYDSTEKALSYYNDEADVTVNLGQENVIRVRNVSGALIPNGSAVYISGATGANLPNISLAQANTLATSECIGLATHDIENNSNGYVTTLGVVRDLNTTGFTAGDEIFLSPSVAGGWTATKPTTDYCVPIGYVTIVNPSTGEVKVTMHPEANRGDLTSASQNETITGAWQFDDDITMGDGVAINWLDTLSASTELLAFTALPTGDPYWANVTLLLDMAGTDGVAATTDLSSSPKTVTFNGGAVIDDAQAKFSTTSCVFDNISGTYLSLPTATFNPGASDFTVECHVMFNDTSTNSLWGNWTTAGHRIALMQMSTSGFNFYGSFNGSTTTLLATAGTLGLSTGVWYHVAVAVVGTAVRVYVDGVEKASTTSKTSALNSSSTTDFRIGQHTADTLNGWIDNFRVTVGTARYTTAFTPPTEEYPTTSGGVGGNQFSVGDPAYDTIIDGLTITLNTASLDVVGAITAASYGGITEANLVDKSAAETITGAWDFSGSLTVGGLHLDDSESITLGTSSDASIYFDGAAEVLYADLSATADFFLRHGTDTAITAIANGAVSLAYDNVDKIATTSTGVSVTGNITVTGTVDGRDVATDGSKLDGIESGATADQSAAEIEAIVNHDNLLGFLSNEHIDWTNATNALVTSSTITGSAVRGTDGATTTEINYAGVYGNRVATYVKNNYTGVNSSLVFQMEATDAGSHFFWYDSAFAMLMKLNVNTGTFTVAGNTDLNGGLDVTGNITVTGTVDGVDIAALEAAVAKTADNETITGTWTFNNSVSVGGLSIGDNETFTWGDANDIVTYYSSPSDIFYIDASATASVIVRHGLDTAITSTPNGAVTLAYDNADKIATTSTGVSVTGNITVTGTVDGRDVAADGSTQDSHIADSDIHVAHSGVTLTAGAGLTGGGTIAASRTFNVGAGTGITVNADDVALSAATIASLALADTALQNVVEDTTPQLGGDLDLNGFGITMRDTRAVDDAPNAFDKEVQFDFKQRSVLGFPGTETYGGVITVAPWGDASGGPNYQLAFCNTTTTPDLSIRSGDHGSLPADWDTWYRLWHDGDFTSSQIALWDSALQDVVDDTTPQLGGNLASNAFDILMADNDQIIFGTGSDVVMRWDGTQFRVSGAATNQNFDFIDGMQVRIYDETETSALELGFEAGAAIINNTDTSGITTDFRLNSTTYFRLQDGNGLSGAQVRDANGNLQYVGFNEMPIYEIDVSDTFDKEHAGYMWHKDAGVAVTFTCDNDSTIAQGATWVVFNDDTEDLTIAQGTGVTIYWLAGGAAPTAGNVTVSQGGIVTVYKYSDTEFWVWGSKEAGGGGGISNVVEDTTPQLGGNLDLNSFTINGTGAINFTGAITASSTITGSSFSGSGASLTSLTAANISSGNLGSGVLPYATTSATASAFKVPFLNTTGVASGNYGLLHDSAATFTYNPSTDTLTAGVFSGTGTGLTLIPAASISPGSFATGVLYYTTAVATASSFAVPFLNTTGTASGNFASYIDSGGGFTYNPSTNTLAAGTFSGSGASLTSLTAANIASGSLGSGVLPYSTASATASAFAVPFLNTTGAASGNFGTLLDSGGGFTYNPSTNTLVAGAFSGSGASLTSLTAANISTGSLANGVNQYFTASSTAAHHKIPFMNYTSTASTNAAMLHDSETTFTYNPSTNEFSAAIIRMPERGTTAPTASAGFGYLWTQTQTPNYLMFTDDASTTKYVGMAQYTLIANQTFDMNTAGNAEKAVNGAWYSDNATAYTLTLENSTGTDFPVGSQLTVWNEGSGTLTINEGTSTTLYYMDGSGSVTDTAGGMTLAQGGFLTIIRKSTTVYLAMGAGGTA